MRRAALIAAALLVLFAVGGTIAWTQTGGETVATQTFVVTYTIPTETVVSTETVTVTVTAPTTTEPPPPPPGEVIDVAVSNPLGWVCRGPQNIALLRVVATGEAGNAVTLDPGCTGVIERVEITTSVADGIKCRNNALVNAHDLVIGGGFIRGIAHAPRAHADGVQCMGGDRITFRNLLIDMRDRPGGGGFYPSLGGAGTGGDPEDVVCDNCHIIHGATSVRVDASVRSGVRNSVICAPVGQAEHAHAVYAHGDTQLVDPVGVSRWPVTVRFGQNEDALIDGNVLAASDDPRCTAEPAVP